MTQHNNSGGNPLLPIFVVGLAAVCFAAYSVLKGWADAWGLDVYSVFYLVLGLGAVGGIVVFFVSVLGAEFGDVMPWMLPFCSLFTFPALNYRAQLGAGPFGVQIHDLAWYGTFLGKSAIFLVCLLIAYGIKKWLDD